VLVEVELIFHTKQHAAKQTKEVFQN